MILSIPDYLVHFPILSIPVVVIIIIQVGFSAMYRMLATLDIAEREHQEAMRGNPHWAVYTIGTLPTFQSKYIYLYPHLYLSLYIYYLYYLSRRSTNRLLTIIIILVIGKGYGSELLAPILAIADMDSLPFYLDTSNEKSIAFFQKNGFEVHKHIPNPDRGPQFWTMVRKPRATTSIPLTPPPMGGYYGDNNGKDNNSNNDSKPPNDGGEVVHV